jgi:nucleoside-diphosphate-sugar epimerase
VLRWTSFAPRPARSRTGRTLTAQALSGSVSQTSTGQRGVLAGELRQRVDRARVGQVVLPIGLLARPSKTYGDNALVVRGAGLYGMHGSASKGGNFVQRMVKRAGEQDSLKMVADQRLQPTFTADLAASLLEAVAKDAGGVLHLTASGACSWFEFTQAIMEIAGIDIPIEPAQTTIGPGQPDRPLNGVVARPRADALGIAPLRPWREALADYMTRVGLPA